MAKQQTTLMAALCAALALAAPGAGAAAFAEPFAVRNYSPFVALFGIPRPAGTAVPERGEWRWSTALALASHFNASTRGGESVTIDGETLRVTPRLDYGFSAGWAASVALPWVRHGGGFLDDIIIDWHDFWGLPQNGRDRSPRDRLRLRYIRDGVTAVDIDSAVSGPGDLELGLQRRLIDGPDQAVTLRAQLKLPTGDPDELTGSGAVDAAIGASAARRWHPDWHTTVYGALTYLGKADVLAEPQRRWAVSGGVDLVWRPRPALSLRLQYDAHTAPYEDTALAELGQWTGLLTAGLSWRLRRGTSLDFAVVENVPHGEPAADVGFHLNLRIDFGGNATVTGP